MYSIATRDYRFHIEKLPKLRLSVHQHRNTRLPVLCKVLRATGNTTVTRVLLGVVFESREYFTLIASFLRPMQCRLSPWGAFEKKLSAASIHLSKPFDDLSCAVRSCATTEVKYASHASVD